MTFKQKEDFIRTGFLLLLAAAKQDTPRLWGKMNLQQMVEHVTDFFNVSHGKIQLPLVTPEEHLPKLKAFLLSDKEFRENTKAPAEILGEEPPAESNESLDFALMQLEKSIHHFFEHFESNPAVFTIHPVFGNLNFEEWILLHYKHVQHHAKQFGLIS
jgi:hypothetical protein